MRKTQIPFSQYLWNTLSKIGNAIFPIKINTIAKIGITAKKINDIVWSDERILQHCQPPFEGRIVLVVVAGVIVISFALFLTASVLCFNTVKNKKSKRYHSINNKEKYLL